MLIGYIISGAIVLSLYYLFLWNPYKKSDDLKTTTETITNFDSTLQSPEPVASALSVQTSTLSTLPWTGWWGW